MSNSITTSVLPTSLAEVSVNTNTPFSAKSPLTTRFSRSSTTPAGSSGAMVGCLYTPPSEYSMTTRLPTRSATDLTVVSSTGGCVAVITKVVFSQVFM